MYSFQEELHRMIDPDQLPIEYGGTGRFGFKSIDDLFDSKKAFACFETPQYRAMLARDFTRTKLNLTEHGEAEAAAAKFEQNNMYDEITSKEVALAVNPKGAGYVC